MIRRLRRKLHPVVLKRIYLGAVLPKWEYACPVWCGGPTQKLIEMHANFCRHNGTVLPSLQTRFDYHTLVMFYKIHTKQAPSYLTSLLPPLSLQDQDTLLENFLTVSQLYQEPQLSTVSYLEQLLCGMPYQLMFNKQAQSMLLRSFSNPILKYKPCSYCKSCPVHSSYPLTTDLRIDGKTVKLHAGGIFTNPTSHFPQAPES